MSGAPVESPCNDVCTLDAQTGWCKGCYRTIDEIGRWSSLVDDDKRAVIAQADRRREAAAGANVARRDPR